jgi:BASS family bile acid:Na+ symporter
VTHDLMRTISLDPWVMLKDIVILLGIPLVAGMWRGAPVPGLRQARAQKPMKMLLDGGVRRCSWWARLAANFQHFLQYIQFVVVVVFIHNGLALVTGFSACRPCWACPSATAAPSPSRWASRTRAWA